MTIRRDLKILEDSGIAILRYGGAIPTQRIAIEFAFEERRRRHLSEKRRIGQAAADLIQLGQTVFMNTGTTTLQVAKALARKDIACKVATNNLLIASELWARGQMEIFLLGGQLRSGSPHLIGPGTEVMLQKLTADLAILGSEGIDPGRGSFTVDTLDASVDEAMARNAHSVVVVADHTKLGKAGSVRYLTIEEMDQLVTDRRANKQVVGELRQRGVQVMLV